ncbi:hypothetical protein SAMN02910358_00005 [Lachnospiraceae bacterium XBB1006]|nr:hypothetical protein SAMN02910358_00005 [Lachnospiraceae bacterium XBB1006]
MGLFSFFKKRKSEAQFHEVVAHYDQNVDVPEKTQQGDLRHQILEGCHQMEESATEYHNAKQEYQSLTSYLTDIQKIEDFGSEERNRLLEIATSIITLEDSTQSMREKVERLPDSKFYQMDREKNEIPKDIRRLKENEELQNMMKRDLDYLEGEKVEWTYEKGELTHEQNVLRIICRSSMIVEALVIAGFLTFFLMEAKMIYTVLLVCMLVIGVVVSGILIRMQNLKSLLKRCNMNYNRAVTIQNSIKLRYVNMKNAVDYTCERYGVSSARELEKNWQLYLEAVKELERLEQANDDLSYYKDALLRLLRRHNLYDAGIWPYQVHALVDHREMVEVKHLLLERRQKVRTRMETSIASIKSTKREVLALAKQHRVYPEEMRGILENIQALVS